MGEPFNRLEDLRAEVFGNMYLSVKDLISEAEKLDYDTFITTQKTWLQNLNIRWLIQGHLTKEEALKIVDATENSIKFNRIDKNTLDLPRCIKLRDKTVYQYEIKNISPKNPNSCVEVIHAYMMDEDHKKSAILRIMTQLMA